VVDFVDSVTIFKTTWKENKKHLIWLVPPVCKNHVIFTKANEKQELWLVTQN
jgi:hypothetical protein